MEKVNLSAYLLSSEVDEVLWTDNNPVIGRDMPAKDANLSRRARLALAVTSSASRYREHATFGS